MGRKLTIYLLDGSATGPKIVDIGNWSGRAFFAPRAALKGVLVRSEFSNPGVYFLRSESQSKDFVDAIYIGEAEELGARLKQHLAGRDFESVTCFLSKDEMLTKAHIRYLESKLILLAKSAGTSKVENANTPNPARLSEADVSDMDYFIEQIQIVLPTVGLNSLVPSIQIASPGTSTPWNTSLKREYRLKSPSFGAQMIESEEGFIVLKGSEANASISRSIAEGWMRLRKNLIDAKVLVPDGEKFIFTTDTTFSSPSAAASVILGRQAAGPMEWVDDRGTQYKDLQVVSASDVNIDGR